MAAVITSPDEILHFPSAMSIEINYRNTQTYSKCKTYDTKAMTQGFKWHQIVVQHMGKVRGMDGCREILNGIFEVVDGAEIFPIAYRRGVKEDRFLVRQCKEALDKLFAKNLRIQISNGAFVNIQVQLNVADYKFGQLSATAKLEQALMGQYDCMETANGEDGILNLSSFANNKEFFDIVVNMGNRAVLDRICDSIYRNDEKFRTVNGLIMSQNGINNLTPLEVFGGVDFALLDLRDNQLRLASRLCRSLKDIKADELLLAGNPITKLKSYPECLKPVLKNFQKVDGIPVENLNKDYTPMDCDIDAECDGYRIDWSNKTELAKFQISGDWHAVMIPDPEQEFSKEEIFDYFFITISNDLSDIYPSYYKYTAGEHQFLVRHCYDQLKHLAENCNLEIKIPRLAAPAPTLDGLEREVLIEKSLVYYLRMDISKFKHGQVEALECIEKALTRRFSAMDRMLNLENFQSIEGLENIIINMSCPKVLSRVLMQSARKYLTSCIELRLGHNKILNANFPKVLSLMNNLKAIDLGNNWIQDLSDIKELQVLGLKSLRLDGNPLCAKYSFAGEYIKAVRQHFPELTRLDNIEITAKANLKSQKNFLCDVRGYDFVQQFVTSYFLTFESTDRLELKDLYHDKAVFSMTCSYGAATVTSHNLKRIAKYATHSRNIFKMQELKRAVTSLHLGPAEIMRVFMTLPNVSHDMLTFTTDTTTFNENMVMITVSGVFLDQAPSIMDSDMMLAFTRTFVLTPVERNLGILKCAVSYQIVNEQFNVYNPTPLQNKNAFKYFKGADDSKKEDITVNDKEALLIMLQEATNLKSIWCTRCLEDANWDFQKALELYLELLAKREVPDSAFI